METPGAGANSPKSRPKIGEVVAGVVGVLFSLGILGAIGYLAFTLLSSVSRAWQAWSRFETGSRCFVQMPDLVLCDPAARRELEQANRAGDYLGVEELIRNGKVIHTEVGAPALVLGRRIADLGALASQLLRTKDQTAPWLERRVRILAGKDRGRAAWVKDRDLASRAEYLKVVLDDSYCPTEAKARAWDAFYQATSPESLTGLLDPLALPEDVKRYLVFMRFPEVAGGADIGKPKRVIPPMPDWTKSRNP